MNIRIDYPSEDEEQLLVERVTSTRVGEKLDLSAVEQSCSATRVVELQRAVLRITAVPEVVAYSVRIARATRQWNGITIGAGPRGSMALLRAARARALLNGVSFVTPDDIKQMAIPVLRHRVTLAPELEIEGHRVDDVLHDILANIEVPRE